MQGKISCLVKVFSAIVIIFSACACNPDPVNTLDPNRDNDSDGWSYNDGDLDDTNPAVNPGAFEVLGNGLDDDCDPTTLDTTPAPDGGPSPVFTGVDPLPLAAAIGLSRTTVADPPLRERRWGLIGAELLTAAGTTPTAEQSSSMRDKQTAIMTHYGTGGTLPRSGLVMAGLSTGMMRDKDDPGYVVPANGSNFSLAGAPPATFLAAHGGALPSGIGCSGVCPTGSGANDSVNLRLTIRVPTNARGFSFRSIFFTAEYQSWTCTAYNDYFLALLTSGAAALPADRNIVFDMNGNCVTVNSRFFAVCEPKDCYTCPAGTALLAGTGMETVGGSTGWLNTVVPVVPGEVITLDFMIFDVSDCLFDSVVLIDDFQWLTENVTNGTGTGP